MILTVVSITKKWKNNNSSHTLIFVFFFIYTFSILIRWILNTHTIVGTVLKNSPISIIMIVYTAWFCALDTWNSVTDGQKKSILPRFWKFAAHRKSRISKREYIFFFNIGQTPDHIRKVIYYVVTYLRSYRSGHMKLLWT